MEASQFVITRIYAHQVHLLRIYTALTLMALLSVSAMAQNGNAWTPIIQLKGTGNQDSLVTGDMYALQGYYTQDDGLSYDLLVEVMQTNFSDQGRGSLFPNGNVLIHARPADGSYTMLNYTLVETGSATPDNPAGIPQVFDIELCFRDLDGSEVIGLSEDTPEFLLSRDTRLASGLPKAKLEGLSSEWQLFSLNPEAAPDRKAWKFMQNASPNDQQNWVKSHLASTTGFKVVFGSKGEDKGWEYRGSNLVMGLTPVQWVQSVEP
ncbi:hypothetical protein [Pontibacter sp. G13]|uniref:hypothetical protein n=1 Tax=Pontibacter sp. G13 TaxID=3074898 RepID=UPI00288C6325|nr:hypothetical protein [Pontibacter sp. G13]WNJ18948.1 hypothetical protein RJD25_00535 [Pontibacter sp. G13]